MRRWWFHPLAKEIKDIDQAETIELHRRMIQSKPLLDHYYRLLYREFSTAYEATRTLPGKVAEIGSGAGFLEETIPDLIKTDVVPSPYVDRVMNAMNLDFADGELRAMFMIGVLHHLPRPARFMAEAERCLVPGGRLVMVESNNNLLMRLLCRFMHHYEFSDPAVKDWVNDHSDRLTRANLALPWIIFIRDRKRFQQEFPTLQIVRITYHTFLMYILSGGMTYRSFLPAFCQPLVRALEFAAIPFMKQLGTAMTIDIVKASSD
ncbi:hypothetical protein NKDENANG_02625 [Candidatus Entotheonellaceae bacterium PAL068K]